MPRPAEEMLRQEGRKGVPEMAVLPPSGLVLVWVFSVQVEKGRLPLNCGGLGAWVCLRVESQP